MEKCMATIIRKIKSGRPYYYAVESKRVNGKPRIVWQKYLGTIESILEMKNNSSYGNVNEVDIFEAGGVAAMLGIANQLKLVEIIDKIVPKRDQGASVGQYILLAALNRILAPCSKLQMEDWYKKSVLQRLWGFSSNVFSSQNFWNHMDLISEEDIEKIQEAVALEIKKIFKIEPNKTLYDTTNFFTYVATGNNRNTIAKRGRNKNKRNDLRQVGLALLVTHGSQIPLYHQTYEGNRADKGLFIDIADDIIKFQKKIFGSKSKTTVVFDKGNISEDALDKFIISGQPFVCAVPKNTDTELFSTDISKFKTIKDLPGTKFYTQSIEIWNKKLKAVLSYSERFYSTESADISNSLVKCKEQ